jgi:hypothetical protein
VAGLRILARFRPFAAIAMQKPLRTVIRRGLGGSSGRSGVNAREREDAENGFQQVLGDGLEELAAGNIAVRPDHLGIDQDVRRNAQADVGVGAEFGIGFDPRSVRGNVHDLAQRAAQHVAAHLGVGSHLCAARLAALAQIDLLIFGRDHRCCSAGLCLMGIHQVWLKSG